MRDYWLIDPRPHQQQADFYRLDTNQAYQPVPLEESPDQAAGVYTSTVLPNFRLRLDWLWQQPLPIYFFLIFTAQTAPPHPHTQS